MGPHRRSARLGLRITFAATLLAISAACGGGSSGGTGGTGGSPPAQPLDAGIAAAMAAYLNPSVSTDAAVQRYLDDVMARFDVATDPALAGISVKQSTFASLRTSADWDTFFARSRSGGSVFVGHPEDAVDTTVGSTRTLAAGDPCPLRSSVVYFVNGILNTQPDAVNSKEFLRAAVRGGIPQADFDEMEFRNFYNQSGLDVAGNQWMCKALGFGVGLFSAAFLSDEAAQISSIYKGARDACLHTVGAIDDLAESVDQWKQQWLPWLPDASHVGLLRTLVAQDVASGKKVILVCHSQGNFFVQQALQGLGSDANGDFRNSVGVVSVASPALFADAGTYGAFQHFTLPRDVVYESVPGALPPNIGNPLSSYPDSSSIDIHSFDHSYLGFPASRAPIVAAVQSMHGSLTNPRAPAGQGFFQVTLKWGTPGDIDLHVTEAGGDHVYWSHKIGQVGELDRDDIPGTGPENYYVCDRHRMVVGTYSISVNNYGGATGTACNVQIRAGSQTATRPVTVGSANGGATLIPVATVTYAADGTFTIQ